MRNRSLFIALASVLLVAGMVWYFLLMRRNAALADAYADAYKNLPPTPSPTPARVPSPTPTPTPAAGPAPVPAVVPGVVPTPVPSPTPTPTPAAGPAPAPVVVPAVVPGPAQGTLPAWLTGLAIDFNAATKQLHLRANTTVPCSATLLRADGTVEQGLNWITNTFNGLQFDSNVAGYNRGFAYPAFADGAGGATPGTAHTVTVYNILDPAQVKYTFPFTLQAAGTNLTVLV